MKNKLIPFLIIFTTLLIWSYAIYFFNGTKAWDYILLHGFQDAVVATVQAYAFYLAYTVLIMICIKSDERKYFFKLFNRTALCWGMGEWNEYTKNNIASKIFYWIKAFIVILFNNKVQHPQKNPIPFITWDHHRGWEGEYDWMELAVGRGFWKGWYYVTYSNGT